MSETIHEFPKPWKLSRTAGGHFKIEDANGRGLAYVYGRNEPGLRDQYLSTDDALVMAQAIARMSIQDGVLSDTA